MTIDRKKFGERLYGCLVAKGFCSRPEQVRCVAKAAAVSPRTARRYLKGESYPRFLDDHLYGLAELLDVMPWWLVTGDGPRTREEQDRMLRMMEKMQAAPKHFQNKLRRATLLRMNGSRRESNLMDLLKSGKLSLWEYLNLV